MEKFLLRCYYPNANEKLINILQSDQINVRLEINELIENGLSKDLYHIARCNNLFLKKPILNTDDKILRILYDEYLKSR
jgi:hypothetical protein